jgi:hypothetical protein
MKKYLVSALAIALVGASIVSIAQSAPMDHTAHGMGMGMMGMDSPGMQAMQKKMSTAKTDEERQALMAEQQKQMADRQGSMAGMSHDGKSAPMDHAGGAMMGMSSGEMQAMHESMQKRMSAAKTDEERQAVMAEQRKLMMEKRAHMMSSNGNGHDMNGMMGNMPERWQMMQKRMGMGMGMGMGMMPM